MEYKGCTKHGGESDLIDLNDRARRCSDEFAVNYNADAEFGRHWELLEGNSLFTTFTEAKHMAHFLSGMWYGQRYCSRCTA